MEPDKQVRIKEAIEAHFEGEEPSNPEDVLKAIYFDILGSPRGEKLEVITR